MTFWHGFAGGLQLGSAARDRWDERGGLAGIFGSGSDGAQAADKPMSDVSAASTEGGSPASPNGPSSSSATNWPSDLNAAAQSIRTIESGSAEGNYSALGPVTNRGDRAYGAYQVMGENIPSWTERHYGQRLTPQQFLENREAQDAVFRGQFGQYMGRYGAEGASRAWFAGEGGMNRMARQDVNGTSVSGYNSRFGQLYTGFLNGGRSSGNRQFTSSSEAGDLPEPIRVEPGALQIPSIFDNQVPADAGQQIQQNPEIEGLVSSARRNAPGLAITEPAAGGVDAAVRGAMPNYVFRRTPGAGPGNTADAMAAAGPEGYGRGRAGVAGGGRAAASDNLQPPLRAGEAAPVASSEIYRDDAPPMPVRVENAAIDPAAAARGGVAPGGRASASADNQPPLRAGEAGPVGSPEIYRDDRPPTEPRVENGDLEARAYASGGVSQGGRGATSAVRPAPGLGLQARAVAPRALRAGEVDSATDPQMAPSPTGTGTATGTASGAAGGRASVSVEVPNAPREAPVPQPRPDPAAEPAPAQAAPTRSARRRAAAPSEGSNSAAPANPPAPQPRPQQAAAANGGRSDLSERDRLMLLRDRESLAPGEEDRLRGGLPAGSFSMPSAGSFSMPGLSNLFGSRRPARPAPAPRAAEKPVGGAAAPRPAAAAAPEAAPATTGSTPPSGEQTHEQAYETPAAPPPAAPTSAPAPAAAAPRSYGSPGEMIAAQRPARDVVADMWANRREYDENRRQVSGPPPAPAGQQAPTASAPAPAREASSEQPAAQVPFPQPRNDQERFANVRTSAQTELDRGASPQRVAERLARQGVPMAEWPPALRAMMERRNPDAPSPMVQDQPSAAPTVAPLPPRRPAPGLAMR
ncbi:hypothetical protein C8P69_101587 [Phreatobacter oligotrophus]|uniref:Uncharacterized protein n=2 Tax=Phreatobacter oligotrophus TaxID=1122261 RepID=A0A2T4ZIZ2_9HYPH|nr:hypothetical protein C8P69_101587 [Phreatobacter oligotrophus]